MKQTQRADELESQLEETEKKLQERLLKESQAGSIAEDALKLNCVFETAQAAVDQYLENIKNTYHII